MNQKLKFPLGYQTRGMFLFQNLCHQSVRKFQLNLSNLRKFLRKQPWVVWSVFWIGWSVFFGITRAIQGRWSFVGIHVGLMTFHSCMIGLMWWSYKRRLRCEEHFRRRLHKVLHPPQNFEVVEEIDFEVIDP